MCFGRQVVGPLYFWWEKESWRARETGGHAFGYIYDFSVAGDLARRCTTISV